jgi:proliferating cell nuclear antigen
MKGLYENCSTFKKIIDSVKDLSPESTIDCTEDGISMQAMDSSHVCLCSFSLKKDGFTEYSCDENVNIGLSLANLSKILKCSGSNDSVSLETTSGSNVIDFQFSDKDGDRVSDFNLKLMEIDQEALGIPDNEYDCILTLKSTEFQKVIKDLKDLGDSCEIKVTENDVTFSVTGDIGSSSIKLKKKLGTIDIVVDEPLCLKYAIRYLSDFSKATSLSDNVIISLSPELPLVVDYDIKVGKGSDIKDVGYLKYYLAPKVDDEDDF